MGVRISFYSIDLDGFERFIEQPIRDVLLLHVGHNTDQTATLRIHSDDTSYYASPAKGIISRKGNDELQFSREKMAQIEFFSMPYKTFLTSGSNFDLSKLFDCCLTIPEINWVKGKEWGNRRWWIGSFLKTARLRIGSQSIDYVFLAGVFQKILRGYDCGIQMPNIPINDVPAFPVIPADDTDPRLGVLAKNEIVRATQIIQYLLADPKLKFIPLDEERSLDTDWHEWVTKMLVDLVALCSIPSQNLALVSFIG